MSQEKMYAARPAPLKFRPLFHWKCIITVLVGGGGGGVVLFFFCFLSFVFVCICFCCCFCLFLFFSLRLLFETTCIYISQYIFHSHSQEVFLLLFVFVLLFYH